MNQLVADFKQYKETGIPASYFGRDIPYDHPHTLPSVRSEQIMHLHLAEETRQWTKQQPQYNRTSDHHLVYCQGFFDLNCFLLMAILRPDAHHQARDNTIMRNLATMAAKFRAEF
ncbi:type II toxin-antitoxin system YafO family toxin [Thiohalobacter thiocyanaticus]|uniref:type II toxin-antitoxin system YafO family toxin n=1 Tax=Thiohalobacter thiocyanaticus TaxID=585455 RepID=UPI001E2A1A61|nr:type II toxin-antitoxin system YafO family toxin [Thiohalobacter thiocyanaticus]